MNNFDSKMVEEILYLLNEHYNGDYDISEFEKKVRLLTFGGNLSDEASNAIIDMVFDFEFSPRNMSIYQSGGGCSGPSVKKPHWTPGFGQPSKNKPTKKPVKSRNNYGSYRPSPTRSNGSC